MPRPPFDPSEIPPPPRSTGPARRERRQFGHVGEAERLTVGELAGLIKTTLEERIASPLRVIGQVSNLARPGHWYFSLKDEDAVVSCVAWASSARKFGFTPDDGENLLVRQKEIYDGAVPSGNSVAMLNLLRLGRITASTDLEAKSSTMVRAFLLASMFRLSPPTLTQ